MKYDDPELRERIAADYALGSLRGAARRRLERLMTTDRGMAEAVERWQIRLNSLAEAMPAIEPPPGVWAAIAREIAPSSPSLDTKIMRFSAPPAAKPWEKIAFWRGMSTAAMAIAATLAIYIAVHPSGKIGGDLPLCVLNDSSGHAAFVATAANHGGTIGLTSLTGAHAEPGRDYQLWLLPKMGKPRAIGVMPPLRNASFVLPGNDATLVENADGIAISLEPAGGSPTGQPTGPILFSGAIIQPS